MAQEEAGLLRHHQIGTEHLLLGLIHNGEGVAARSLERFDLSLASVRNRVQETTAVSKSPRKARPLSPRAKNALEPSVREALQQGHEYVGTEHLLLGILREGEGTAARVLVSLGVDLGHVRSEVLGHIHSLSEGYTPEGTGVEETYSREVPHSPRTSSARQ